MKKAKAHRKNKVIRKKVFIASADMTINNKG